MNPVTTWSGVLGVMAECRDCEWESEARNAMGNAKQHAARHGHRVRVEQTVGVHYAPAGMSKDEVFR